MRPCKVKCAPVQSNGEYSAVGGRGKNTLLGGNLQGIELNGKEEA